MNSRKYLFAGRALSALAVFALLGAADYQEAWGPPTGSAMPPISAPDQHGTVRDLASLSGANGLLLVAVRSADWCPFCQRQLLRLKDWQGDFEALGVHVAALSYDDQETLEEFAEAQNIGYALLSDQGSKHIDALGIRNEQYEQGHFAHGVPHPGVFFVDATGVIRLKRAQPGYRERPAFDELLSAVDAVSAVDAADEAATPPDSPDSTAPP